MIKNELEACLPDTISPLRLKGCDDTMDIYRDSFGIAHVRANSANDAFFGQGFVTAQDRFWHMDFDRHCAYGRWSEYVGDVGVEQDKTMRRFQIEASVKSDYESVNTETKSMVDAHTAGINAYLGSTDRLPFEYSLINCEPEPWMPWDCFAVYKVRHIMMGVFEGKLWRAKLVNLLGPEKATELLTGYQQGHLLIVPPGTGYEGPLLNGTVAFNDGLSAIEWMKEDVNVGSNSWAVHGSRTKSGKPILAGDSHRRLDTPNAYYQAHIACPEFDVIGLSFPGCPGFPHFGHNAHVAWSVTHANGDYQDLYVERFRSGPDGVEYEYRGDWISAEVRKETINAKGKPPVEMDVVVTRHGPVFLGDPQRGFGLTFKYTATASPNFGFECFPEMLKAASADELDASMEKWVDPCNNFVFVDVHGDIGYLNRGQVPIRSMTNAWLPVAGWTGEQEWEGHIPFDRLTRMKNPDTGFVVTANNRIVGDDYPYYIGLNYVPEYRARRIYERLKEIPAATVEEMASVHMERLSIPGKILTRRLWEIEPGDDSIAEARDILTGWDGRMDRDMVAPTIYAALRMHLMRTIITHLTGPAVSQEMFTAGGRGAPRHLSELMSLLITHARDDDTSLLPPDTGWADLLSEALTHGVAYLRERFGHNIEDWRWGRVHRTNSRHPLSDLNEDYSQYLDPPGVSMHGDADTPLQGGYSPGKPFDVMLLSVVRYVYDAADWDNSKWVMPLGVSGHPGSPHYTDQTRFWGDGELVPMLYSWEKVKSAAESYQKIEPLK